MGDGAKHFENSEGNAIDAEAASISPQTSKIFSPARSRPPPRSKPGCHVRPAPGNQHQAIAYAEKNVAASLDYAEKLLHATDLAE